MTARMVFQAAGVLGLLFVMHFCLNTPLTFSIRLPRYPQPMPRARIATAKTQIASLGCALETYRLDVGAYPSSTQGLDALIHLPTGLPKPKRWKGSYLADATSIPLDPWDHHYVFAGRADGKACSISCYGKDGRPGGSGDAADIVKELTPDRSDIEVNDAEGVPGGGDRYVVTNRARGKPRL